MDNSSMGPHSMMDPYYCHGVTETSNTHFWSQSQSLIWKFPYCNIARSSTPSHDQEKIHITKHQSVVTSSTWSKNACLSMQGLKSSLKGDWYHTGFGFISFQDLHFGPGNMWGSSDNSWEAQWAVTQVRSQLRTRILWWAPDIRETQIWWCSSSMRMPQWNRSAPTWESTTIIQQHQRSYNWNQAKWQQVLPIKGLQFY